jgi:tripartite-type tricarboxylate transporter receptor subunit TctC
MTFSRRRFLHIVATAFAAFPEIARAQAYPARPLRIAVGGPPGGAIDILARLIGQWLTDHWGEPVVLESKPGAGTNIATEYVVHAAPDGYTLLLVAPPAAINATLYDHLSFNFVRDIAPVAGIITVPNIMLVNPQFPAKTVPDFIAYAKANPGKINFASAGNGTSPHMTAELFKMMTGVDMVHVAYRGEAPAITDLLGGQVQVMFATATASIEQVRAGKLLPLAVSSATRFEALPDLPTIGSFVPGYEAGAFFGVGAPKGTPADIVDKLNREINAALADPKMKGRLAELGGTVSPGTPADFGKLIASETEKWGKVVKFAGIKAE